MRRLLAILTSAVLVPLPLPAQVVPCAQEQAYEGEGFDHDLAWIPYFIELDDVTGGEPVPVGVDGVAGHRVGEVVRLHLRVVDDEGRTPDGPLTLRVGVTGERHGQVRMLGSTEWCDVVKLTWETDSTGLVTPPNVLEYRLGTLATPAGWLPDSFNPHRPWGLRTGAARAVPLWRVSERLQVSLRGLETNTQRAYNRVVVVRPEAGPPERFEWGPSYTLPSGFLEVHALHGRVGERNTLSRRRLYALSDRHGNRVVEDEDGPRLAVTSPLPNLRGRLVPERVDVDAAPGLYTLELEWERAASGWPTGEVTLALKAEGAFERAIEGTLTVSFVRGPMRTVEVWPGFEPEDALTPDVLEVSPGAPRVREIAGKEPVDTPGDDGLLRTPLLFFAGDDLPEPSAVTTLNSASPGEAGPARRGARDRILRGVSTAHDVWIEDESGQRATDAELLVSLCPRSESKTCRLAPLVSREGLVRDARASRGYLGLMVRRAPLKSGRYYARVAGSQRAAGATHRLEGSRDPLHEDAVLAVRVRGFAFLGEDLDQDSLLVDHVLRGYLVLPAPGEASDDLTAYVSSRRSDGRYVTPEAPVRLRRLGDSSTFVGALVHAGEGFRKSRLRGANGPVVATAFRSHVEARREGPPEPALSAALADAFSCLTDVARLYRQASEAASGETFTAPRCGPHAGSVLRDGHLESPCLEQARVLARILPGSDSLSRLERDEAVERQAATWRHASGLLGWALAAASVSGWKPPADVGEIVRFARSQRRDDVPLEDAWGTPLRYEVSPGSTGAEAARLRVQSAGGDGRFERIAAATTAAPATAAAAASGGTTPDPFADVVLEERAEESPDGFREYPSPRPYREAREDPSMTDLGPALRELREAEAAWRRSKH